MTFQFARFLIVGCLNTASGLAVIFAAKAFFGLGDIVSNALGYAVGLTVSFLLNRSWTFHHEGAVFGALLRFVLVFAVAYAANLATLLSLIEWAGVNSYFAQAFGMVTYTAIFFFLSRLYAFRKNPAEASTVPFEADPIQPGRDKRGTY